MRVPQQHSNHPIFAAHGGGRGSAAQRWRAGGGTSSPAALARRQPPGLVVSSSWLPGRASGGQVRHCAPAACEHSVQTRPLLHARRRRPQEAGYQRSSACCIPEDREEGGPTEGFRNHIRITCFTCHDGHATVSHPSPPQPDGPGMDEAAHAGAEYSIIWTVNSLPIPSALSPPFPC